MLEWNWCARRHYGRNKRDKCTFDVTNFFFAFSCRIQTQQQRCCTNTKSQSQTKMENRWPKWNRFEMHQHHINRCMALWTLSTNKFLKLSLSECTFCEIYFPDCCMIACISYRPFAHPHKHTHTAFDWIPNKQNGIEKYGDRKFFFLNLLLIKCLNRFLRHGWPLVYFSLPVSHFLSLDFLIQHFFLILFVCSFVCSSNFFLFLSLIAIFLSVKNWKFIEAWWK